MFQICRADLWPMAIRFWRSLWQSWIWITSSWTVQLFSLPSHRPKLIQIPWVVDVDVCLHVFFRFKCPKRTQKICKKCAAKDYHKFLHPKVEFSYQINKLSLFQTILTLIEKIDCKNNHRKSMIFTNNVWWFFFHIFLKND